MGDVTPHFCTGIGCEALHGGRESDEVKVAKIYADRDVEVARLARSEARQEIEAEIEQTEIIADAAVEETAIEAEAIVEAGLAEPEEEMSEIEAPVVITAPEPELEEEAVPEPPETSGAPAAKKSAGWWDGYQ